MNDIYNDEYERIQAVGFCDIKELNEWLNKNIGIVIRKILSSECASSEHYSLTIILFYSRKKQR